MQAKYPAWCGGFSLVAGFAFILLAVASVSRLTAAPASIQAQVRTVAIDSGPQVNPHPREEVVFSQVVELGSNVPWVRLAFSDVRLSTGSVVRVTSLADGESQVLDATAMEEWGNASAFFNGSCVLVELIAAPESSGDRLVVAEAVGGDTAPYAHQPPAEGSGTVATICDDTDSRAPSADPRVGRLILHSRKIDPDDPDAQVIVLPDCTAFIIDTPDGSDKLHLTAGHCFGNIDYRLRQRLLDNAVLQFNVPASRTDCSFRHPPVDRQFPVNRFAVISVNQLRGNDWAVFRCHRQMGLTTFERQGTAVELKTGVPPSSAEQRVQVEIIGYGIDGASLLLHGSECGWPDSEHCDAESEGASRNGVQQSATGGAWLGTLDDEDDSKPVLLNDVDTCKGNSGSPILFQGSAIGIQTHGGCAPVIINGEVIDVKDGLGTPIDHPDLRDAITYMEGPENCQAVCKLGPGGELLALSEEECHMLCDQICGDNSANVLACFFLGENVKGSCEALCKDDFSSQATVSTEEICQSECDDICSGSENVLLCIFKAKNIRGGLCSATCKDGLNGAGNVQDEEACHPKCRQICVSEENVQACFYENKNIKGNCEAICLDGRVVHLVIPHVDAGICHEFCDDICLGNENVRECILKGQTIKFNENIPTLSAWGCVVLVLVLLVGAKTGFHRRHRLLPI